MPIDHIRDFVRDLEVLGYSSKNGAIYVDDEHIGGAAKVPLAKWERPLSSEIKIDYSNLPLCFANDVNELKRLVFDYSDKAMLKIVEVGKIDYLKRFRRLLTKIDNGGLEGKVKQDALSLPDSGRLGD